MTKAVDNDLRFQHGIVREAYRPKFPWSGTSLCEELFCKDLPCAADRSVFQNLQGKGIKSSQKGWRDVIAIITALLLLWP